MAAIFETMSLQGDKMLVQFHQPDDTIFYFYDHDVRDYSSNMQFQHFHPHYEMFILLDNSAAHIIEGQYYDLKMYDIVCLRPGILHKTYYPLGEPKKRIILQFAFPHVGSPLEEEYSKLFSLFDRQTPIYRLSGPTQQRMVQALYSLQQNCSGNGELDRLKFHNILVGMLTDLYMNVGENTYQSGTRGNALSDKVYDICAYIHKHYDQPLNLTTLAQQFYTSPCHLSRQFPKITGFTLTEYIQRTRVRNAQQALMFTSQKITEIASLCGFTSFSQFNRVFHKICNVSPSEYRKQNEHLKAVN